MQDRYVGDLGDFGKYALLRAICGSVSEPELRLGINWYLFPDENHNNDGRHISYLKSGNMRLLDSELHDALAALVHGDQRLVSAVMRGSIFPQETVFVDGAIEPIEDGSRPRRSDRVLHRSNWFEAALRKVEDSDIVFLDPDNGIEVKSAPYGSPKSGKYVYWNELRAFFARGQSLVIYHHTNRKSSVAKQVHELSQRFEEELGASAAVKPLIFRRGSCRVFWLILFEPVRVAVEERIAAFLASGWADHFEVGGV